MLKRLIITTIGVLCPLFVWAEATPTVATIAPYDMSQYNQDLQPWWQQRASASKDLTVRLAGASAWLLGKPYVLFPNGEGPMGEIDQGPLYRSDKFDCTTYVVTVIAMTESQNLPAFKQRYKDLMYKDGQVDFFHRNHFASIDLNDNNQATGALSDITPTIKDRDGKPLAKILTNDINKPAWFKRTGIDRVRLLKQPSASQWANIKKLLKHYQAVSQNESVSVGYIPVSAIVNANGEVNSDVLRQIPNASIIEIVYEDPHDIAIAGTNMQIAHMGFVFDTPQGQIFREASSLYNKVIDVPLKQEMRQMQQDSTILGIHIEQVR